MKAIVLLLLVAVLILEDSLISSAFVLHEGPSWRVQTRTTFRRPSSTQPLFAAEDDSFSDTALTSKFCSFVRSFSSSNILIFLRSLVEEAMVRPFPSWKHSGGDLQRSESQSSWYPETATRIFGLALGGRALEGSQSNYWHSALEAPIPCSVQNRLAELFEPANHELYDLMEANPGPSMEKRPFTKFDYKWRWIKAFLGRVFATYNS